MISHYHGRFQIKRTTNIYRQVGQVGICRASWKSWGKWERMINQAYWKSNIKIMRVSSKY